MRLQQLNAFRAIITNGSVTAAAQKLSITQPAVTRLIHSLEHDLGFMLFDRSHKRLVPTPDARVLFEQIDEIGQRLEQLDDAIQAIRDKPSGSLHIAAMPMLSISFIPRLLGAFIDQASLLVTLRNYRSEQVCSHAELQLCDMGFAILPDDHHLPACVDRVRFCGEQVCLMPANSELSNQSVITPSMLAGKPMIGYEHQETQAVIDASFRAAGVSYRKVAEASFAYAVGSMVAAGLGYAVVDPFTAIQLAELGVDFKPFRPSLPFHFDILLPVSRPLSRLGAEFLASFFQCVHEEGICYRLELMPEHLKETFAALTTSSSALVAG